MNISRVFARDTYEKVVGLTRAGCKCPSRGVRLPDAIGSKVKARVASCLSILIHKAL